MARCGHVGQCSCVITGGPGIGVSGIGTPEQPYDIRARLSTDSGNTLRFDGTGALYAGGGGGAEGCGVSVAGLPTDHLTIGRGGAGRFLAPDHTLRSYTRAIDLSLPAVHVRCRPLSDGTPVAYPALSTRNQTGDYPQADTWPGLPSTHGDYLVPNMDVSHYKRMPVFAGWDRTFQPERQRSTYNPGGGLPPIHYNQGNLGGRWGFFGFGEQMMIGGLTLSEVLSHVALRTVVMIEMVSTTDQFIDLVLQMVRRHCAQEAVIVSAQDPVDLEPFAQDNIATMLWINNEEAAAANPPAQVVAQGIGWVSIGSDMPDDTIVGYSAQGLDVIIGTLSRHSHWGRVDDLGARGCLSDDPVYMMGFDDPTIHRVASGHTSMRHYGVLPGQLSYRTDEQAYWPPWSRGEKLMGWGPDGTSTGPVPVLPPQSAADATQWMNSSAPIPNRSMSGYGLVIPRSGSDIEPPNGIHDILAGWLCPVPNPQNYAIEYQGSFCSSPNQSGRNFGIFFGLPDDRTYQDHMDAGSVFWQASFQWNSLLFLRRYENGGVAESVSVDTSENVQIGAWFRFRVIVDDVSVTLQRVQNDGTIRNELVLPGEAFGPYVMLYKNELGGDGNYYPFTSGHRQLWLQSPFDGSAPVALNPDGSYPWETGDDQDTFALMAEEAKIEPQSFGLDVEGSDQG